jgi:hypothetical protein
MNDIKQGRHITGIPRGGSANHGHAVAFVLKFGDGTEEQYFCDYSLLPLLVGNLKHYGDLAERIQSGMPRNAIKLSAPYVITKVVRSAHSLDGKTVAVEFDTNQGFPLEIAMTQEQALQTIEFLHREIRRAAKAPQHKGHN